MKTVLIISAILTALLLFGLLFPAIIAAIIAWILFTSGHIGWGIVCCIAGLIAEIGYIAEAFTDDGNDHYDDEERSGFSWLRAFTVFYIIDHILDKDD